jgi:hypothetical protein
MKIPIVVPETPQGLQSEFSYVPWSSPADASDLVMDW